MRRLFIIRKDLHLSAEKLAVVVAHCAEAYWAKLISENTLGEVFQGTGGNQEFMKPQNVYRVCFDIDKDIYEQYIDGTFIQTIYEAKNKNQLLKAKTIAKELGLAEDVDFGFVNGCCLPELTTENENGTCIVGIWFRPLDDEKAYEISKKYQPYKV